MTNNATGIAGITWQGRILPVRVLGKCGGNDSDIISAVLWAAGIHVNGVPDNPDPAKIINMSLGSPGTVPCILARCDLAGRRARRARGGLCGQRGRAGRFARELPGRGRCRRAAARRHQGRIQQSRPRDCARRAGRQLRQHRAEPCLYSIDTTSNDGATTPGANIYTDQTNFNVGTSFSAPIVAGIAALMTAVNSQLNPAQLIGRLQSGAKPFPKSPDTTVPDCHVPASGI